MEKSMEQEHEHEGKKPECDLKLAINHNLEQETDAIDGYYKLLENEGLLPEDRKKIVELIADEKNHQLILQAMVRNYDGGIEATKDGRKEAMDELTTKKPEALKRVMEEDDEEEPGDFDDETEVIFLTSLGGGKKGSKK